LPADVLEHALDRGQLTGVGLGPTGRRDVGPAV